MHDCNWKHPIATKQTGGSQGEFTYIFMHIMYDSALSALVLNLPQYISHTLEFTGLKLMLRRSANNRDVWALISP